MFCSSCGIRDNFCSLLFVFGVNESIVSGVEYNISYLSLVTIESDKKDSCDESWGCVSGTLLVSGITVISSVVGFLWFY